MSDKEQPPTPNQPQGPRGEKPAGGFNWRVFILFGVALTLLAIAWETSDISKKSAKMSFETLKTEWERGRVVVANPGDPNYDVKKKNFPLKIVSSDAGVMVQVTGFLLPETTLPQIDKEGEVRDFRVSLNVFAQSKELEDILQEGVKYSIVDELPAANGEEALTLDQFRQFLAQGAVITNSVENAKPLSVLTTDDSTNVVIVGQRFLTKDPEVSPNSSKLYDPKNKDLQPFYVPLDMRMREMSDLDFMSKSAEKEMKDSTWSSILVSLLPFLLLILLLFFLFRFQMKSAGRGAMSFGKSKAKLMNMSKGKVTFKDVAGIEEAKEELNEIVEFLRDPKRFQKLGGSIPKGVLMVGSPGTGKTLLARAIAGEADVPFFSISGSDFVEMFVGVGASRVRDMFEQGRKNAPCLIFIDEIDAVGRHRGQGMGGGNDEREQTLNAMLVEMDGFDSQEGVIIIAATNRPDVLDPALLRPGRFDRQVTVSLPDVIGREQILKVHAKKIKMADGVDLGVIARGTPGFSGAELANLINESALLAARKRLKAVTLAELEEARDKVRWGRERRSLALTEEDKRKTAYHEAGHSVLQVTLENTDPIHKVTIIPRGPALGSMMYLPERDKFSQHRNEMLDNLIVLMGGRVAEEIMLDDIANGAMGDIRMATNIARSMVCEWGMSPELGMVEYKDSVDGYMPGNAQYSEAFAQKIDQEIKRFTDEAYRKATEILTAKRDKLELIAEALMEYETLDGQHIIDIMEHGEMKDPPPSPKPPALPPSEPVESKPVVEEPQEDDEDGPIGDPIASPA